MSANLSREADARMAFGSALRASLREAPRYFVASAIALSVDTGLYIGLISLADIYYLAAAPVGYAAGILVIYILSTRWVFHDRRLTSVPREFLIFTVIGIVGLFLNQLVIYVCVESLSKSYELAKLASAASVFGVNFVGRKLFLFTRFRRASR